MKQFSLLTAVVVCAFTMIACGDSGDSPEGPRCGDGTIDLGEVCDGNNVGVFTCESQGFGPGILLCAATCATLDTSRCGPSATCGDGTIDGSDVCDGNDIGDATCESEGFGPGTLTCLVNCAGFDTSGCSAPPTCGNNKLDPGEACDGALLNGRSCADYDFEEGQLACNDSCTDFITSACSGGSCVPECGNRQCGPDPVCGESCGECGEFERCTEAGICERTCDLDTIESPQSIDINLDTVMVGGTVTLNGAQMPDNSYSYDRGYLRFTNTSTNDYLSVSIGENGAATFNIELFAGTYDVTFRPADDDDQTVLPFMDVVLEKGRLIEDVTELNYDLRTVDVGGVVTLNGQQMPDNNYNYDRGYLRFYNKQSGDYLSVSLKSSGAASYNLKLYAGTYDVKLYPADDDDQTVMPNLNITLAQAVVIDGVRQLDYNLETVDAGGVVTLNGAQMPDNNYNYDRGYLRFYNAQSGDYVSTSLKSSGPASYNVTLFKGTYDVKLYPADDDDQTVIPYLNLVLEKGRNITQVAELNYDLRTVDVGGVVSLNGQQMPDNNYNYDRGYLRFYNKGSNDYLSVSLKASGPASYNIKLYAGTYDVKLYPADDDDQTVMPHLNMILQKDVVIESVQQLDYNLETVSVGGVVTLNGAQMPDNNYNYDRGYLRFYNKQSADYLSVSLKASGPASYNLTLFKGLYDVKLYPADDDDQTVMPNLHFRIGKNVDIQSVQELNYNADTVMVGGTVTLNGVQMPNNSYSYDRGWLRFVNKNGSDYLNASIGETGPGTYNIELFAGAYDVYVRPADDDDQTVMPYLNVKVRTGCASIVSDCTLDAADISGTWDVVAENPQWGTWTFTITQSGDAVTGSFLNSYGQSSELTEGSRSGNEIDFIIKPYCTVQVHATVVNGCVMTGWMQDISCGNTDPYTNWTGERLP